MSKLINFEEHKSKRDFYYKGLLLGVLRVEIENGKVDPKLVYSILSNDGKEVIDGQNI